MALQFKVETLDDRVRFTVKGVVVELSYHAASALCNNILGACFERKRFSSNKFVYWKWQAQKGKRVKVRKRNQTEYEDFVKSLGISIDTLQDSNLGKHNIGKRWKQENPRPKKPKPVRLITYSEKSLERARVYQARRDKGAAKQAKIKELQERFDITPKEPQP